ncbi:hypothetical protein T09_5589 [Trichinella sp. T9]|nr:hypothetical protein T09_5589 [Trichinella sp. T9]
MDALAIAQLIPLIRLRSTGLVSFRFRLGMESIRIHLFQNCISFEMRFGHLFLILNSHTFISQSKNAALLCILPFSNKTFLESN